MFRFFNVILIVGLLIFVACNQVTSADNTVTVIDLTWEDLIPEEFSLPSIMKKHNITIDDVNRMNDSDPQAKKILDELWAAYENAPVAHKLNGKTVRISGFVVPLESSEQISEFLLVPYFGACIHVPPPPANQIIYIRSDKGISIEKLSYPVRVAGMLKTESTSSDLAESGYSMNAYEIMPIDSSGI